jgi:hypothetical protein
MRLKINKCSDPSMWYAGLVGQSVELVKEDAEGYWSREPAGFINIVRREDAEVVNDES